MEAKNVTGVICLIFLAFFGIPIRIKKPDLPQDELAFKSYILRFNKSYVNNETEYKIRFENFKENLRQIEELNRNRTSNESALYGLTIFSDLSQCEFKLQKLQVNFTAYQINSKSSKESDEQSPKVKKKLEKKYRKLKKFVKKVNETLSNYFIEYRIKRETTKPLKLPKKVDWREKGIITPVRNQKTCGACWAFSTIETVEAMNALKTGSLQSLSVQEVIDCAKNGNFGCEGGDSCTLLEWLKVNKIKILPEKFYPLAYETQTCKLKAEDGVAIKTSSCDNFVGSEDSLIEKLANHGPVAAAVNAINWQFYLGGVIQFHCSGSLENLNHAVQIVGYDQTAEVPHYIVRNSWGVEFGDKGYIYIAIGNNICGVANEVSSLDVS